MRTVICTKYGPPEVLQLTETTKPIPKQNEILIRIRATTVTVADRRVRSFDVPKAVWLPVRLFLGLRKPRKAVLGVELAGEVEAVGQAVQRFKPGDAVFAASLNNFGAYADYICLPENSPISLKPTNCTFEEAAALPIGARTALHFLRKGNLKKGQKILIYGASGSVGTYAVQLAKYFGAQVTGVCSSRNAALVQSLGADRVIDYTADDFLQQLERYDMIFLAVDRWPFSVANRFLTKEGVFIDITNPIKNLPMLWTSLTTAKKIIASENVTDSAEDLRFLQELTEAEILKPVVDKNYPLTQIVEAHRYVDSGHKRGNVTITVS